MIKPLILAALAFVVFLLVHSTYFHLRRPSQRARSVIVTYLVCSALYALIWVVSPAEAWWASLLRLTERGIILPNYYSVVGSLTGYLLYTLLFIGYLEFYFTADRSISFLILVQIEKEGSKGATVSGLAQELQMDAYFRRRFDDLVYGGYLRQVGMTYYNTPKGRLFARLYSSTIRYLHLQE